MILTLNFDGLKRAFPFIANKIPCFIAEDPSYIFKVDTQTGICEGGYIEDNWVLK